LVDSQHGESLTGKYGIDATDLETRLNWVAMAERDLELIRKSAEHLRADAKTIVERFYDHSFAFPDFAAKIEESSSERSILEGAQLDYLLTLLNGRVDDEYVGRILGVGETHARLDVKPRWNLGNYATYASEIYPRLAADAVATIRQRIDGTGQAATQPALSTPAADAADDGDPPSELPLNIELLEQTFQAVAPHGEELVEYFYDQLFEQYPSVRPLFANANMADQRGKLLAALATVVASLRDPATLVPHLQRLGERHAEYGAEPAHYDAVGGVLLQSLKHIAGDAWTDEIAKAWGEAYGLVASVMIEAAEALDQESQAPVAAAQPPSITAGTEDIAVISAIEAEVTELIDRVVAFQRMFVRDGSLAVEAYVGGLMDRLIDLNGKLGPSASALADGTNQVDTAAREIASATQQIATTATEQTEAMEGARREMEQLTTSINQVAAGAGRPRSSAGRRKHVGRGGGPPQRAGDGRRDGDDQLRGRLNLRPDWRTQPERARDRRDHKHDLGDRGPDEPAGPQRSHRGRTRRRGGPGIRGRRRRGAITRGAIEHRREGDRHLDREGAGRSRPLGGGDGVGRR
jgi:hemoglobin-like flavoprotein